MDTRIIAWACALAAACAPGLATGASGITPEHAELSARIKLAAAYTLAAEMRALMTEYDRYEIEMHTSDALELPPGRSSLRTWKNERNAEWRHIVTIKTITVDSTIKGICKAFHEELSVRRNGHAVSAPAIRDAIACRPMRGGIVVERTWKIHKPGSVPHDANVPKSTEPFIDP
ncbi:MAG TPA: hypothetical protein VLB83_00585 [Candidatus Paceibacterota bacterium]|nr:hypothetical protein [Candidatus Paceibacterota bacterium]